MHPAATTATPISIALLLPRSYRVAGSTASRYILSAGRSTYWSTGRCCGAPDMGAAVRGRAPTSAASDRDLLPETVQNDAPTRERSRLTIGAYHHGQVCVRPYQAPDSPAPSRRGKDGERRAVASAARETAPLAQHPRCGCRGRSRRRAHRYRDDSAAAQRHLELAGNRG